MEWFVALVAVLVIGVAAVAASGRLGQFSETSTDRPEPQWPDGPLTSSDIDNLGFAVVPRGYAMDQIDEFCERVKARLEELERQAAETAERRTSRPGSAAPRSPKSPIVPTPAVRVEYDDAEADFEDYDSGAAAASPTSAKAYTGSVVSPLRSKVQGPRRLSAWR